MVYDVVIIGSGPAGMSAAIYAARRKMKTLVIGKELGGQLIWASHIDNYPGFSSIMSYELIQKMQEQVKENGVKIVSQEVMEIKKTSEGFDLLSAQGEIKTKALITAIGLTPRRLAIKGEIDFQGKGVTYCANCDGPFYKGKDVLVVGGGNSALDAAEYLSKICNKVYLVHRRDEFRGFDAIVEEIKKRENIELCLNSEVLEIKGSSAVEQVIIKNNQEIERILSVNGVFVEVGRIANTDLVQHLVDRDNKMRILVDEKCQTKTPGLFAAGDVTQVPYKQISIAAGQGTIAALATYQYLQEKSGNKTEIILDRA